MKQVIVVFERPDIGAVQQLLAQIPEAEVWVFDPHLLDNLHDNGITDARFIDVDLDVDIPSHVANLQASATATGHAIEAGLRKRIPDASGCHWQYLNYYHLLSLFLQYAPLWDRLLASIADTAFHVPLRDVPATYYAHSFIPAVLLLERLSARGIPFQAHSYARIDAIPQFIPTRLPEPSAVHDIFVHLPTCIYDQDYYADELAATGLRLLNFAAQNWNVPFPSLPTVELVHAEEVYATLPEDQCHTIDAVLADLTVALEEFFERHIRTAAFAHRQAAHLTQQYKAQLVFFRFLNNRFASKPPKKLVLSNHDSGLHGPLVSFAKAHNVPMVLLPHAKVFNYPITVTQANLTVLTHPLQGGLISDFTGRRVPSFPVLFREQQQRSTRTTGRMATIGIVLNKFSMDGTTQVDPDHYLGGLRSLLGWCRGQGIRTILRSKPGGSCIRWLAAGLSVDIGELAHGMAGTLADFAQGCDLCILYDAPTSGAIDLLRLSIPTINTVFRPMGAQEASIVDDRLVPVLSVAATLERLDCYQKDPTHLAIFRNQQFAGYIGRFGHGLPLHAYL